VKLAKSNVSEIEPSQTTTAEAKKPCKKNSVFLYLSLLFIVAFFLLLLSYLMQQRTNDAINGIQETVQSFQTINDLYENTQDLETQLADANDQIDALQNQLTDVESQLTAAQKELETTKSALQQAQDTINGQAASDIEANTTP